MGRHGGWTQAARVTYGALSGLNADGGTVPRELPWAEGLRPVGAEEGTGEGGFCGPRKTGSGEPGVRGPLGNRLADG
jgi:hypothetical protein